MITIFKEAERNTIIVNEINKWKQNKILPASYCDFLINLYDGPGGNNANIAQASNASLLEDQVCENKENIKNKLTPIKLMILIVSVFITSGLIALIVSFNNFDSSIQIIFLLSLVIITYLFLIFYKLNGRNEVLLLLTHNFSSILFVFIVLYITQILGMDKMNLLMLFSFLAVFLVWLLTGIWFKHIIVFIASLVGTTIVYYYYVFTVTSNSGLLINQAYWLPLALIIFWIAYSVNQHEHLHRYSLILLGMSILYYFMAEVLAIAHGGQALSLIFLAFKVIVLAFGFYLIKTKFKLIKAKDLELIADEKYF